MLSQLYPAGKRQKAQKELNRFTDARKATCVNSCEVVDADTDEFMIGGNERLSQKNRATCAARDSNPEPAD